MFISDYVQVINFFVDLILLVMQFFFLFFKVKLSIKVLKRGFEIIKMEKFFFLFYNLNIYIVKVFFQDYELNDLNQKVKFFKIIKKK